MAYLAKTACRRCREQKLRCSRELPACDRCVRLNAACDFPKPPDRKALAAFRGQSKKTRVDSPNLERSASSTHPEPPTPHSAYSPFQRREDVPVEEGTSGNAGLQLSLAVQTLLQDVYFTCMFNSTLILHRPSFSRAFQEERVPQHVLLAVYASATIFLPPSSITARRNAIILQPLGDLKSLGRQWAVRAGREVLQDIDQPSVESVQTCEMLTLYWFSAGESQRNTMFCGIAYKAACTLGLDLREPAPSSRSRSPPEAADSQVHDREATRRCFWAVWFTQCINSDHRLGGTSDHDGIMNLPLPRADTAVDSIAGHHEVTLSSVFKQSSESPIEELANPSIMAELMILVLVWAKTRDLIRATKVVSARDWLADLFELESRLSTWSSRLPGCFAYSKRNLYEQLVVQRQPVYVFVHALYHQCRLVLHSALVPRFSGLHLHQRLPPEASSLSARIALGSVQALSEIGADLLALDWDPAEIPAFVGYCMYVGASINVTLLGSRDAAMAAHARTNLASNLRLLKSLKIFWTNLERLWVRINLLYAAQTAQHRAPTREGNDGPSNLQLHLSELDQLAGEVRDTGQLSEPLADSVLEYTLRRLRPGAKADSGTVQALERTVYDEDLSQIIHEDQSLPKQSSTAPLVRMDGQWDYLARDQSNSAGIQNFYIPGPWDRMGASSMTALQNDDYGWWQLGLDSLQQPILPYEELFNLDCNV